MSPDPETAEPAGAAPELGAAPAAPPPPGQKAGAARRHSDHAWMAHIQSLLVTIVIAVFVITFLVQAFEIPSESMEDTLLIGDYLLVDKTHYAPAGIWDHILPYSDVRRQEIVVFRYPLHPADHFVKRVIGLPGDHVRLWHRRVYVNGQPLNEPYVVYKDSFPDQFRDNFPNGYADSPQANPRWRVELHRNVVNGELVVPPDCYFVMGDNRNQSADSRYWGFVPRQNIIGRPLLIHWSVRNHAGGDDGAPSWDMNDKLSTWWRILVHPQRELRWRRMFRLVR